jgi:competence protein ComEC
MNFPKKFIFVITILFSIAVSSIGLATPAPLSVHFIDVGQADSILVHTPGDHNMLVDAGNNEDAETVTSYLSRQGVKKINILVGTHPHEDHIGGMDAVVQQYQIGQIYMPKASSNTKTFRDVLQAIKDKGLKVSSPVPGSAIALDPTIKVQVLAPNSSQYEDLNNYSIVLKVTYGKTSFLLTGDAERESENEMLLSSAVSPKADLLKVGHHGSSSSTSAAFLKAVAPKYAVISVGKDNDYGHPKSVTLNRLQQAGVTVYRTDLYGTIVAESDGQTIKINKKASPIKPNAPPLTKASGAAIENNQNQNSDVTVYITKSERKYHVAGCNGLSRSCIPISLEEAKQRGYGPCKQCNPPQ